MNIESKAFVPSTGSEGHCLIFFYTKSTTESLPLKSKETRQNDFSFLLNDLIWQYVLDFSPENILSPVFV